jgi:hypothetical protein
MNDTRLLELALSYAARGWQVFPLKPGSKVPATPNGFKDATTWKHQIRNWWGLENPSYNIGIATGEKSGIVVLDVDKKHGGLETFDNALAPTCPPTFTVQTGGGGIHLYFAHPGEAVNNRAGLLPGIDIRGDGGYVVAAGSITDGEYNIVGEGELAPMPAFMKQQPKPARNVELPGRAAASTEEKGRLARATLDFIAMGAEPGTWHATFFKAAMDLKQNNYSLEEAAELLAKASPEGVLDDSHDWPQLEDVYKNREPRHPPRIQDNSEEGGEPELEEAGSREAGAKPGARLLVTAASLATASTSYLSDKDAVKGEPTGIESLDKLLGGGVRLGEVTAWHAEAKTGKNTIWHKLMFMWLERGIPLGYASRELTPESEVLPNLYSLKFQENAWLADMTEERKGLYEAAAASWPLFFAEGYGTFPREDIVRWVKEGKAAGIQYFWFDHLHYMLEDPEDHKEASKLIKQIKALAKDEMVNIQIIIQPNKLMEGQKLSLNSIKGGSAMGQAIDNLITVEHTNEKNVRKIILKAARAKLTKLGHFYLQYSHDTTDFIEVEEQELQEEAPPTAAFPVGGLPKPRLWPYNPVA